MSKAALGNHWVGKIYFYPQADDPKATPLEYTNDVDSMMAKLKKMIGTNEMIEEVQAYKGALSGLQLTKEILYHMFLVFRTAEWYWTIEKHQDGITIQRSKSLAAVRDRWRLKDRLSGIERMKSDEGKLCVYNLIHWIFQKNELDKTYHLRFSNCQHFASAAFNHVALKKTI